MAKKIEDFVTNLSKTEMGVQVCVEVEEPPDDYKRVTAVYYVYPEDRDWPRFKAMSAQVQRALGFRGHFDSVMVRKNKHGATEVQLSYKAARKADNNETGRVQSRTASKRKTKQQRKKGKK